MLLNHLPTQKVLAVPVEELLLIEVVFGNGFFRRNEHDI